MVIEFSEPFTKRWFRLTTDWNVIVFDLDLPTLGANRIRMRRMVCGPALYEYQKLFNDWWHFCKTAVVFRREFRTTDSVYHARSFYDRNASLSGCKCLSHSICSMLWHMIEYVLRKGREWWSLVYERSQNYDSGRLPTRRLSRRLFIFLSKPPAFSAQKGSEQAYSTNTKTMKIIVNPRAKAMEISGELRSAETSYTTECKCNMTKASPKFNILRPQLYKSHCISFHSKGRERWVLFMIGHKTMIYEN